jgi:hypothetical protein
MNKNSMSASTEGNESEEGDTVLDFTSGAGTVERAAWN